MPILESELEFYGRKNFKFEGLSQTLPLWERIDIKLKENMRFEGRINQKSNTKIFSFSMWWQTAAKIVELNNNKKFLTGNNSLTSINWDN